MGKKRVVSVSVLPGEPPSSAGRVCIHLFVPDPAGPFVEPHALHPVVRDGEVVKQQLEAKPTRGRLACDPRRTVVPVIRGGITTVTHRTDSPGAVTCPKCLASNDYQKMTTNQQS